MTSVLFDSETAMHPARRFLMRIAPGDSFGKLTSVSANFVVAGVKWRFRRVRRARGRSAEPVAAAEARKEPGHARSRAFEHVSSIILTYLARNRDNVTVRLAGGN